MSVLERIVEDTRDEIHRRRSATPLAQLEAALAERPEGRPFSEALSRPGTSLIAEHKRRSPSAGAIREDASLQELLREARGLDLDAVVEVHDERELEIALDVEADVLGLNNRDLADFSVDIERTYELLSDVPAGKTVVSESGYSTRDELDELERVGVDAVLIGETFMRASDPEVAVRELTRGEEPTQA